MGGPGMWKKMRWLALVGFALIPLACSSNGSSSVRGTVGGYYSIDAQDALAQVEPSAGSSGWRIHVEIWNRGGACSYYEQHLQPPNTMVLGLTVSGPGEAPLPGTYQEHQQPSANNLLVDFTSYNSGCSGSIFEADASSITITISEVTASSISGSFTVGHFANTPSSSSGVTGTFKAPICDPTFSRIGGFRPILLCRS
jgi:hypothetical protein